MSPSVNLRPKLAAHLQQRLQAFEEGFRHNLALIGPAGSGKTFQLQQLLESKPSVNLLLLYCPLFPESSRSFLTRFLSSLLASALENSGHNEPAMESPQPACPSLRQWIHLAQPAFPRTAAAVESIENLIARRFYSEAFTRALDVVGILGEESRRPCVLILDEVMHLEDLGLTHAFHELGKRVMTSPTTLFILTSSSIHRSRAVLRERLQLLFGQFQLIALEALEAPIATAWVQEQLRDIGDAKEASSFLIHWLGGYPWYLSMFLQRLAERIRLSGQSHVTESVFLQTAWDVLGSPEGPLFQWCRLRVERVSQDKRGNRSVEALTQIAEGARTTTEIAKRIGRAGLTEAMQRLVEEDLALRNGNCWVIPDPLLRFWLATVFSSQRNDPRMNPATSRQRLENYLQSCWARWMQNRQLTFAEQVVELFSKFSDDTVSLDSKTGRLPHFEAITRHPKDHSPEEATYIIAQGEGKSWCASVQESAVDEAAIARFEAFCKQQAIKPSRKVVICRQSIEPNARLLAKSTNMWVWGTQDLSILEGLYEHY
ncbi:MAG: ATP-binding protein [Candidatus Omnitrophica bacterium]|nr:ATP-binding protein [Candidatus Omnitrophota bacterium]MBI2173828.1 ATP-binding protein [Candidatus Omnitrophota bacterium]MBI3009557.1 ATP-binding protein [Candidatus Omnitrophota bacterium]